MKIMAMNTPLFKYIVTALCFAVGFSGPLAADEARLAELFDQLQEAEPEDLARIEGQIVTIWGRSGSAAMDLLMRRGEDAMEDSDPEAAVEHFTALVDHAPEFAEGYHGRATAYYQLGLVGPALDDLRQTLVLNPQHFGAMTGFAVILEEVGRPEDSLDVWRMVAEITPADPEVQSVIGRLETQLEGTTL